MRELSTEEINQVNGGVSWTEGGLVIITLGASGGLATGLFGLAVGGSMLVVGHYAGE